MELSGQEAEPGMTLVASNGDITVFDFTPGVDPLETLLGADCYHGVVLFCLENSTYVDSSGVGWLLQCHNRFHSAGGRLVLHSIPPMVNHCFRVLGMYDILTIAKDKETALQMAMTPAAV